MTGSRSLQQQKAGKRRRRSMRGGANAPNPSSYTSASSWGTAVNGSGDSQFNRTFDGSGPAIYTGVQGQKAGGKRRSKKGGFWGQILNQALVPFSILGLQQTYRRNKHGGKRTRRNRH
jgi:hypothetical protein